ncbi:LysR family transcriptional regulator [Neisseria sp. 23W00734]
MFAFGFGNAQGSLKTRQPTPPRKPLHARQSRFKPAQNPARPIEEQSVTRAAARLSLTQPAVSGMLARLRHHFDDPLLVRTPQGMVPTERARALAAPLARILSDIDALVQPAAFDPAALDTVFKIGITDNAFASIALPFLQKIQTLAPNVKTAFSACNTSRWKSGSRRARWMPRLPPTSPRPRGCATKCSTANTSSAPCAATTLF